MLVSFLICSRSSVKWWYIYLQSNYEREFTVYLFTRLIDRRPNVSENLSGGTIIVNGRLHTQIHCNQIISSSNIMDLLKYRREMEAKRWPTTSHHNQHSGLQHICLCLHQFIVLYRLQYYPHPSDKLMSYTVSNKI